MTFSSGRSHANISNTFFSSKMPSVFTRAFCIVTDRSLTNSPKSESSGRLSRMLMNSVSDASQSSPRAASTGGDSRGESPAHTPIRFTLADR